MDINLDIRDLLYVHDCIILPGFGGFVTNYANAYISEKNIFYPTRKVVAFNIKLINDDGLLINYIVEKEGVKYSEAKSLVLNYVNDLKTKLSSSKEVVFDGIGNFKFDKNNILQFEPLQTSNFNIDTYGLSTFHFSKIKREKEVEKVISIFKDKKVDNPKVVKFPLKRIIAASFLLIILSMISYDTNIITDLKVNLTTLYPTAKNIKSKNIINKPAKITKEKNSIKKNIVKETKAKVETNIIENSPQQAIQTISDEKQYQLIAGCFQVLENAENFVKDLLDKGLSPAILISHKGLYKVSVGSYDSKKDATSQLYILRNKTPEIFVWLSKN